MLVIVPLTMAKSVIVNFRPVILYLLLLSFGLVLIRNKLKLPVLSTFASLCVAQVK